MFRISWTEGERQGCHKGEASEVRKKDLLKVINSCAAEPELKVAEKAREHLVEIETEIEVEEQKAAELKNKVQTVKKSLEEEQNKAYDVLTGCEANSSTIQGR